MPLRIGIGHDIHRIEPGGRLMLAGVAVASDLHAVAHSDGDVVLHAFVDAIYGALGLGDIGERFPNTDPLWKDADSTVFVQEAMRQLHAQGGSVVNVDVTILAERPKLKAFKVAMRESLATLTRCKHVNVKAGTNEGVDAIGRGEAIAAHVAALIDVAG